MAERSASKDSTKKEVQDAAAAPAPAATQEQQADGGAAKQTEELPKLLEFETPNTSTKYVFVGKQQINSRGAPTLSVNARAAPQQQSNRLFQPVQQGRRQKSSNQQQQQPSSQLKRVEAPEGFSADGFIFFNVTQGPYGTVADVYQVFKAKKEQPAATTNVNEKSEANNINDQNQQPAQPQPQPQPAQQQQQQKPAKQSAQQQQQQQHHRRQRYQQPAQNYGYADFAPVQPYGAAYPQQRNHGFHQNRYLDPYQSEFSYNLPGFQNQYAQYGNQYGAQQSFFGADNAAFDRVQRQYQQGSNYNINSVANKNSTVNNDKKDGERRKRDGKREHRKRDKQAAAAAAAAAAAQAAAPVAAADSQAVNNISEQAAVSSPVRLISPAVAQLEAEIQKITTEQSATVVV